jgi:hypothetical protein
MGVSYVSETGKVPLKLSDGRGEPTSINPFDAAFESDKPAFCVPAEAEGRRGPKSVFIRVPACQGAVYRAAHRDHSAGVLSRWNLLASVEDVGTQSHPPADPGGRSVRAALFGQ